MCINYYETIKLIFKIVSKKAGNCHVAHEAILLYSVHIAIVIKQVYTATSTHFTHDQANKHLQPVQVMIRLHTIYLKLRDNNCLMNKIIQSYIDLSRIAQAHRSTDSN